jgi:hypothetical protein
MVQHSTRWQPGSTVIFACIYECHALAHHPKPHYLITVCTPQAARTWFQDGAAAPRTAGVCADAVPAPVATDTTANAFSGAASSAAGWRAPAAPLRPRACSTCAPKAPSADYQALRRDRLRAEHVLSCRLPHGIGMEIKHM